MDKTGINYMNELMYVFIEFIAQGIYTDLDDIQQDAKEYIAMKRAVEKLSNWNPSKDKIEDVAKIFEGMSHSITEHAKQKAQKEEEDASLEMPPELDLGDITC